MNRCLSDQLLLQCYAGDGAADDLAHLRNCLACAGRYKELQADMALITEALDAPPPRRRAGSGALARWRVAVSAAAIAAAFFLGWSLRGRLLPQFGAAHPQLALHQAAPTRPPIQVSALEPASIEASGATPAIYAAYVQDAFGGIPCSDANDPLDPGCL